MSGNRSCDIHWSGSSLTVTIEAQLEQGNSYILCGYMSGEYYRCFECTYRIPRRQEGPDIPEEGRSPGNKGPAPIGLSESDLAPSK